MPVSREELYAFVGGCVEPEDIPIHVLREDIIGCIVDSIRAAYSVSPKNDELDDYVIPAWLKQCSYQQQSVLLLALRGPDGVRKHHPAKLVHTAYRGTMLRAAERGRFLEWGENADSFMSMHVIGTEEKDYFLLACRDLGTWQGAVDEFFDHVDELPHHYVAHLAHAAQIIGFKHPDERFRRAWGWFYQRWVEDAHLNPETEYQMDKRLGDWGKARARLGLLGYGFGVDASPKPKGGEPKKTVPPADAEADRVRSLILANLDTRDGSGVHTGSAAFTDTVNRIMSLWSKTASHSSSDVSVILQTMDMSQMSNNGTQAGWLTSYAYAANEIAKGGE